MARFSLENGDVVMRGDDGIHQFFRVAMMVRMIEDGCFHDGLCAFNIMYGKFIWFE